MKYNLTTEAFDTLMNKLLIETMNNLSKNIKLLFDKGSLKKNWEKAENVKITRQVVIFGVILPFYKGKKWVNILIWGESLSNCSTVSRGP